MHKSLSNSIASVTEGSVCVHVLLSRASLPAREPHIRVITGGHIINVDSVGLLFKLFLLHIGCV